MAQNSKLLWQKSGDIYKISKGVDRVLRRYLVLSGVSILSQTAKGAKAGWTTQALVLKGLQPTLSAKIMLKWFKTILSAKTVGCMSGLCQPLAVYREGVLLLSDPKHTDYMFVQNKEGLLRCHWNCRKCIAIALNRSLALFI